MSWEFNIQIRMRTSLAVVAAKKPANALLTCASVHQYGVAHDPSHWYTNSCAIK